MTIAEAKRTWPGPDPAYGGVVIGEAYDPLADRVANIPFDPSNRATWGQGGSAPLLIDPCRGTSTHSLLFSGSGGYKTTGSAVPTLLHWRGSAIVLDPSLELSPMLADARRRMQHEVFTLHPETAHVVGFNALEWIDIDSPDGGNRHPVGRRMDLRRGPERQCDGGIFYGPWQGAGGLSSCAYALGRRLVGRTENTADATLGAGNPEPELREILSEIHRSSPSRMARDLAGTLKGLVDETSAASMRTPTSARPGFPTGPLPGSSPERRSAPPTSRTGGRRCLSPCRSRPCRARRPWPVPSSARFLTPSSSGRGRSRAACCSCSTRSRASAASLFWRRPAMPAVNTA